MPLKLFVNPKGWAKIDIALARGKKLHDKRHDLKAKDDKPLAVLAGATSPRKILSKFSNPKLKL